MKLITEYDEDIEAEILTEDIVGQDHKQMFFKGPFLQAAVQNKNGRVYPVEILEHQVNNYIRDHVSTRSALGELNHPQRPNVDPREASHLVTEITRSGNDFFGKAKVLTHHPVGQIVEGLIIDGVRIGVSSRGVGSLKENTSGILEVQNDYRLMAIDVVTNPSGPDCFVNGIMEGVDWIINNGGFQPVQIEAARKYVDHKAATRSLDEAELFNVFNRMMSLLSK